MNTPVPPLPNSKPSSSLAVTSMVLGIISIPTALACGIGILLAIPAIIMGHIALGRTKRDPGQFGGGGMAVAGFVTGYCALALAVLILPAMLLPALAKAKARATQIKCVNNLKQITIAANLWAAENGNQFPAHFILIKNELETPKLLVCPNDKNKTPALDWSTLSPANISYEIVSPGTTSRDPSTVFARCPIHGSEAYVDGSVQMKTAPPRR